MKPRVEYVILVAILMVYVLQSGAALAALDGSFIYW